MASQFSQLGAASDLCRQAYQVCKHSHPVPWSESVFNDCLSSPYFANAILDGKTLQGYYIGLMVADEATLMDIAVHPSARKQGVGRRLLTHFIAQCEQFNAMSCWLEVRASNTAAIALYEQFHFVQIARRKGYYAMAGDGNSKEDALIMQRTLKNS